MDKFSTENFNKAKQLFVAGLEQFHQLQYRKTRDLFEESLKLAPDRESTLTN